MKCQGCSVSVNDMLGTGNVTVCRPGQYVRLQNRLPSAQPKMATPAGLEPATPRLEGRLSSHLNYGAAPSGSPGLRSCRDAGCTLYLRSARTEFIEIRRGIGSADAVGFEVIGIGFGFGRALLRCFDRIVQAVLLRIGLGLFERIEFQPDLVQGVLGADPAHQGLGLASGRLLEFQNPMLRAGRP